MNSRANPAIRSLHVNENSTLEFNSMEEVISGGTKFGFTIGETIMLKGVDGVAYMTLKSTDEHGDGIEHPGVGWWVFKELKGFPVKDFVRCESTDETLKIYRSKYTVGDVVVTFGKSIIGDRYPVFRKIMHDDDGTGILLENGLYANLIEFSDISDMKIELAKLSEILNRPKDLITSNDIALNSIRSNNLDISDDTYKIKMVNLSDEVLTVLTGGAPVNNVIADGAISRNKIANNAVDVSKVDFIHTGNNIFTGTNCEDGLLYSNGSIQNDTDIKKKYKTTDYLPIMKGRTYYLNHCRKFLMYDELKKPIQGTMNEEYIERFSFTPLTDGYVRVSLSKGIDGTSPYKNFYFSDVSPMYTEYSLSLSNSPKNIYSLNDIYGMGWDKILEAGYTINSATGNLVVGGYWISPIIKKTNFTHILNCGGYVLYDKELLPVDQKRTDDKIQSYDISNVEFEYFRIAINDISLLNLLDFDIQQGMKFKKQPILRRLWNSSIVNDENILDTCYDDTFIENTFLNMDNTLTYGLGYVTTHIFEVEPSTLYYTSSARKILILDGSFNFCEFIDRTDITSIKTNERAKYIRVTFNRPVDICNLFVKKSLNKSTMISNKIMSLSELEDIRKNLNLEYKDSKNLINIIESVDGYLNENGTVNGSSVARPYVTTDYITVKRGVTYVVSGFRKMLSYDLSKVPIQGSFMETTVGHKFTPSIDCYVRFSFFKNDQDADARVESINNAILHIGETLGPWVPYTRRTLANDLILLPHNYTDNINLVENCIMGASTPYLENMVDGYIEPGNVINTNLNTYITTKTIDIESDTIYTFTRARKVLELDSELNDVSYHSNTITQLKTNSRSAYLRLTFFKEDLISDKIFFNKGDLVESVRLNEGEYILKNKKLNTKERAEVEELILSNKPTVPEFSEFMEMGLCDVDRIGLIGDSYTESHYALKGKAYINKLSLFSDYNFENNAVSGDIYRGQIDKIRNGFNRYHNSLAWKNYLPKYALLISYTNDLKYMDHDTYGHDLRATIETVMSLGASPIVCSEYHQNHGNIIGTVLKNIADEYGLHTIDMLDYCMDIRGGKDYANFWGGSHPGTRTNHILSDYIEHELDRILPRPDKSIKIFRKRDFVNAVSLDDLLFYTNEERACKFKEILIGHSALVDPKKVDECTGASNSRVISEYLNIQNKENVSFRDYALISAVLPFVSRDIINVGLKLNNILGLKVYIKDALKPPFPSHKVYQRFDTNMTIGNVKVGDTYSSNDPGMSGTVFTVIEVQEKTIIMSPTLRKNFESGILTRISGTGESTVPYIYSAIGYTSDRPSGKMDLGHWSEMTYDDNVGGYISDNLGKVDLDKMHILLVKNGEFSINDVTILYKTKKSSKIKNVRYNNVFNETIRSKDILDTVLTSSTDLSNFVVSPGMVLEETLDGVYPRSSTRVLKISENNNISKDILVTHDTPRVIFIETIARYNPPIYSPSQDYKLSKITEDSFDYRNVTVKVDFSGKTTILKKIVGLHWKKVIFKVKLPVGVNSFKFTIGADGDSVELGSIKAYAMI